MYKQIKDVLFPVLNIKLSLVQRTMIGIYFASLALVPFVLVGFVATLVYTAYDTVK